MSAQIPEDGVIFWVGAVASIPAGWEVWTPATSTDGRFFIGCSAAQEPGVTGGVIAHNHDSTPHDHDDEHNHSLSIIGNSVGTTLVLNSGRSGALGVHIHSSGLTASHKQTLGAHTAFYGSVQGLPTYIKVNMIKPISGGKDLPDGCIIFSDRNISDDDLTVVANTDWEGAIIRGETSDSGATGGADEHSHTITGHLHSIVTHNHLDSNFGGGFSILQFATADVVNNAIVNSIHHSCTSIQNTLRTCGSNSLTLNREISFPPYKTLMPLENITGSDIETKPGMVIGFVGDRADIPDGWEECTELRELHIRLTRENGSLGDTGGQEEHFHTNVPHTHQLSSHTHTYTFGNFNAVPRKTDVAGVAVTSDTHTHTSNSMFTKINDATFAEITCSSDAQANRWLSIIWIRIPYVNSVHIKGATIKGGHIAGI